MDREGGSPAYLRPRCAGVRRGSFGAAGEPDGRVRNDPCEGREPGLRGPQGMPSPDCLPRGRAATPAVEAGRQLSARAHRRLHIALGCRAWVARAAGRQWRGLHGSPPSCVTGRSGATKYWGARNAPCEFPSLRRHDPDQIRRVRRLPSQPCQCRTPLETAARLNAHGRAVHLGRVSVRARAQSECAFRVTRTAGSGHCPSPSPRKVFVMRSRTTGELAHTHDRLPSPAGTRHAMSGPLARLNAGGPPGEPEHPQQDPAPMPPRNPVNPAPQQPELPPVSPHTPTLPEPHMRRHPVAHG